MVSQPAAATEERPNLFGLSVEELAERLEPYSVPRFHARQIYRWLYARRVFDPLRWTDLSMSLRRRLADEVVVDPGSLGEQVEAADRTVKYRARLAGGGIVESVYMEQSDRVTLCISSQVGCALDCKFCLTGKMGFGRHLDSGEIVGQVALIQQDKLLDDRPFNIVFMGMGEPLHNYDAVLQAFRLLTDAEGFGLSRRRITVSTSGLAPAIERLAREPSRPRLAVSLNAATDEVRQRIMPVNRKYPLSRLLQACRTFGETTRERFTFEYVLLAGINDSPKQIERLADIVRPLPAKLNLIPFNDVPGLLEFRSPGRERILFLRDQLLAMRVP